MLLSPSFMVHLHTHGSCLFSLVEHVFWNHWNVSMALKWGPWLWHENQLHYLTVIQHVFEHEQSIVSDIWNKVVYYTSLLLSLVLRYALVMEVALCHCRPSFIMKPRWAMEVWNFPLLTCQLVSAILFIWDCWKSGFFLKHSSNECHKLVLWKLRTNSACAEV